MPTIHFVLQGKGGVGKSMIFSLFISDSCRSWHEVSAVDTDPVNATLKGLKSSMFLARPLTPDGI